MPQEQRGIDWPQAVKKKKPTLHKHNTSEMTGKGGMHNY